MKCGNACDRAVPGEVPGEIVAHSSLSFTPPPPLCARASSTPLQLMQGVGMVALLLYGMRVRALMMRRVAQLHEQHRVLELAPRSMELLAGDAASKYSAAVSRVRGTCHSVIGLQLAIACAPSGEQAASLQLRPHLTPLPVLVPDDAVHGSVERIRAEHVHTEHLAAGEWWPRTVLSRQNAAPFGALCTGMDKDADVPTQTAACFIAAVSTATRPRMPWGELSGKHEGQSSPGVGCAVGAENRRWEHSSRRKPTDHCQP